MQLGKKSAFDPRTSKNRIMEESFYDGTDS